VLLALVLAAYQGVTHAGFIWDDDAHVTRAGLRSLRGLWRIWTEPGATQQYYPVLHSAFWVEHRLWGDAPAGYHAANVLLHAAAACLLLRVLRVLALPGAFLAAALFAVHPVCAESVAWISEEKNTLSAVFYLSAALVYMGSERGRRPSAYAAATALFALALLSKSVTATLPAAVLVVIWWRRGRLSLKGDVLPLAPWFAMGAGAGAMTSWMERTHIGASGAAFGLGAAGRFLVAARALWFYLGKIAWPADLMFIYPRWPIEPGRPRAVPLPRGSCRRVRVPLDDTGAHPRPPRRGAPLRRDALPRARVRQRLPLPVLLRRRPLPVPCGGDGPLGGLGRLCGSGGAAAARGPARSMGRGCGRRGPPRHADVAPGGDVLRPRDALEGDHRPQPGVLDGLQQPCLGTPGQGPGGRGDNRCPCGPRRRTGRRGGAPHARRRSDAGGPPEGGLSANSTGRSRYSRPAPSPTTTSATCSSRRAASTRPWPITRRP
jgi:hypothetical protein